MTQPASKKPRLTLGLRNRIFLALLLVGALLTLALAWQPGNWLLAALVALAAGLFVAAYLFRTITGPINDLSEATRRMAAGEIESLELPVPPELAELTEAVSSIVKAVNTQTLELQQRAKELQALVNLSGVFLDSMDARVTLEAALREAVAATHAEAGAAFMVLPDGDNFETVAVLSLPKDQVGLQYPINAHTAPGYAMMLRKAIASVDVNTETRFRVPLAVLKFGVVSVLTAPMMIEGRVVGAITLDTLKRYEFSTEEINAVQAIANHTAIAIERIKLVKDLSESYDRILSALVTALDTRDRETEGHSQRVVAYSLALADNVGVSTEMRQQIERGALLHDIGKIGVPDAILHKTAKLSEEEWAIVRNHPEWGKQILEGMGFLSKPAEIVVAHHERWDGKGYPRGLKGEQIPLGARIFAVADAFDAMTSYRAYRDPRTFQKAREEIRNGSGNQFDPEVVAAFLKIDRDTWIRLREESQGSDGATGDGVDMSSLRRIGSGQLQAMNMIVAAITSSLDLNEVVEKCVQTINDVTRAAAAGVYFYDAQKNEFNFAVGPELPQQLKKPQDDKTWNEALGLDLVKEGVTQFHQDLDESQEGPAQLLKAMQPNWKSGLIIPLQDGERTLGALVLFGNMPHVFDEDERVLFDHVAKQLSQAIVNARLHEKVRVQAITDALTGAYNRRYLDDFLNIEVKRCQRYKRPLALVMVDMDKFKMCNDSSGHQAGDKALQDVVQLLNMGVRSVDLVARYGGEEFLMVLPETDAAGALEAAERIRRMIEKHRFPCGSLTASVGVVANSYQNGDAPGVEELIARADKALFKAKQDGRNKVQLWNAKLAGDNKAYGPRQ